MGLDASTNAAGKGGELWPFHRLKQPLAGLVTFVTGAILELPLQCGQLN